MSLARRSITSISWNFAANTALVGILAVRMVLLTRWLTPEIYGEYAFAYAIIVLSAILPNFGMGQAFLHRAPQMENVDDAAAVHFTLRLLFTSLWAAVLLAGTYLFAENGIRLALFVLIPVSLFSQLTQTPDLLLRRRVEHRRLAAADFTDAVLSTAVALLLAWNGAGLWALLATDIIAMFVRVFYLYIWRPVWQPRLQWNAVLVRYYLQFGSRALIAEALSMAIDRVDDLWTGTFLGQSALGIYSRAYSFAVYPRKLLAAPVNAVAGGAYAELKGDRLRLSQSYFRINAFLVRSGFLFAGALFLVAPELVLLLGEQWQDMLAPFRLMLLFVLFEPIKVTTGLLFVAVGWPQRLAWSRAVQLLILVSGLFLLGPRWGVNGVALAVDIMLLVGIALLLWQARQFVDFSVGRMFAIPLFAFLAALLSTLAVLRTFPLQNIWLAALVKLALFSLVYLAVWLAAEKDESRRMLRDLRRVFAQQEAIEDQPDTADAAR